MGRLLNFRSVLVLAVSLGLCAAGQGGATAEATRSSAAKTLEDLYGDTGQFFQGSIGFWNFEAGPGDPPPPVGYGIAIDDVVVEWREFSLVQDTTDCAAGECAVVSLTSNNTFEGSTLITITVLEKTPDADNDCDLDGTPDGTNDCDGNGTADVVVRAASNVESPGEIVHCNATGTPFEYKADLPVSAGYDTDGVLFVAQRGTDAPRVTVTYVDQDDGTGQSCQNDVDPAAWGRVQATTTLFINTGDIRVLSTMLTDNGDQDGFADTNETVEMRIKIHNKTDWDLTGLTARVSTNDPKIDCIFDTTIFIGGVAADAEIFSSGALRFRVADVDRTTLGLSDTDDLSAGFQILFSADQFDGLVAPQFIQIDLDLDAEGGSGPTTFFEGFESGTFGTFTPMNIDASLHSHQASDGHRCQYSDPDLPWSNSYAEITDCYLGASQVQADTFYWQVHTPAVFDGGRAYSGSNSLYMGIFGFAPDEHTTPMAVLEAMRLEDPINLGILGEPPQFSFKHQVDLWNYRSGPGRFGTGTGRAVVHLQLADENDDPVGDWIKLQPYVNVYDIQGTDYFSQCTFDPIDDGNTEDDFFDPTDPGRRLGPSSTCYPEFCWSYQGETFSPFQEDNLGRASDGPGLSGSLGLGTWVEPKFNLERFRGRRVRLRFLNTDIKVGSYETWQQVYLINPSPGDDGWWIDDVLVTNTLTEPATMGSDDKDNTLLPGCGAICNEVTATVAIDPPGGLPAPGQVVELSALASVADRCLDGILQYRFWIDGDDDGAGGGAQDRLLRGWTDNPALIDAPQSTTRFVADVRCSSDTSCLGSSSVEVRVHCPSSGSFSFPTIMADDSSTLSWSGLQTYDVVEGMLADLASYTTTVHLQNQGPSSSYGIGGDAPTTGSGFWYLLRESGPLGAGATVYCNDPGISWGQGSRDTALP